jgi:hypothetical protein
MRPFHATNDQKLSSIVGNENLGRGILDCVQNKLILSFLFQIFIPGCSAPSAAHAAHQLRDRRLGHKLFHKA